MFQTIEKNNPKMFGTFQLTAGAIMISFSGVFVKLANVGPTSSAFYRMLFGGVLLAIIALVAKKKFWNGWAPLCIIITCGVFFTVDLTLWHRSILYVGPGLATILANFQVFFLAGFGIIILNERLTLRYVLSIPLGLFGLFLIVGIHWPAFDKDYKLGVFLGLLTALAYASFILMLRKLQSLKEKSSPLSAIASISIIAAIFFACQMVLEGESFAIPDTRSLVSLVAYGVMGQVLGWVFISRGIIYVDASKAGLIILLQPSLALVWDMFFFHRPVGILEILGCVIAIAAIYTGSTTEKT